MTIRSIKEIIPELKSVKADVYVWYEGPKGISDRGAEFYRDQIIRPLLEQMSQVQLILYSLRGWDFAGEVKETKIDLPKMVWFSAQRFFEYCNEARGPICEYVSRILPLRKNPVQVQDVGKKVKDFFQGPLLASIADVDINQAYSNLQFLEGYFLVRNSLLRGQKKMIFLLPNDESKYYEGFEEAAREMLRLEFGKVEIEFSFYFFSYGKFIKDRPYQGPNKVTDIAKYFNWGSVCSGC